MREKNHVKLRTAPYIASKILLQPSVGQVARMDNEVVSMCNRNWRQTAPHGIVSPDIQFTDHLHQSHFGPSEKGNKICLNRALLDASSILHNYMCWNAIR